MRDTKGRFIDGHSFTSEMLEKMSAAKIGKKPTCPFLKNHVPWNKGTMGLMGVPWNKGINTETNKDLRTGEERECPVCGNKFYIQKYLLDSGRKKFCSKSCFFKGRELKSTFQAGEKHPGWIDGNWRNAYTSEFTPALKNKIRLRDNYTCQLCGITELEHKLKFNRVLSVNHIDFDKNNCCEDNLNTLCTGCNTKINWDREYYKNYFKQEV